MSLRFRSLISIAFSSAVSAFQVDNAESLTRTLNNVAPQSFSTRSGRRVLRHILILAFTFRIWIDCFQLISRYLCIQPSCCCIPKAMVGWERRMRSTLTEREGLSALEHLRIEIQVHSNALWGVNNCLIYWLKMWCYSWFWMDTCKI